MPPHLPVILIKFSLSIQHEDFEDNGGAKVPEQLDCAFGMLTRFTVNAAYGYLVVSVALNQPLGCGGADIAESQPRIWGQVQGGKGICRQDM